MNDDNQKKQGGSGRAAPLLLSVILLLAIGAVLYMLYKAAQGKVEEDPAALKAGRDRVAALARQKTELENMARLDPCVIRQALGLPPKAAPAQPGGAAPQGAPASPTAPQSQINPAVLPASSTPAAPAAPPATGVAPQSSAPAETSQSPQRIARKTSVEKVEDATVFVLNISQQGVSTGTGFFITPDLVMTNRHVAGETRGRIFVINRKLGRALEAKLAAVSPSSREGGRDYAVLRVAGPSGVEPLALRANPRRADKVNAWGYPYAVSQGDPKYQALMRGQISSAPELVYSDGAISAVLERNPPLIAHTAPLSQGNSGGPLTDENGMVVGINTLISLDETSYRQTSLALPASDMAVFLQQNGIQVPLR